MNKQTTQLEFSKEYTAIIKGVALLLMILHHCLIPSFWNIPLHELNSTIIVSFGSTCKICVGIFTFMVGYGYAFAAKKDFQYGLNHIIKLLIPYWVILFIFTLPVGFKEIDFYLFFLNLFGINSQYNWFSWFVAFFIFSMFILPIITKHINNKRVMLTGGGGIILFYSLAVALHQLCPNYSENNFIQRLFDCLDETPCMILGYLFASQKWFECIQIPSKLNNPITAVVLFIIAFLLRNRLANVLGFNLNFFYVPLAILAILVFFNTCRIPYLKSILISIGNNSVYMWFFHALFFTKITSDFYQPMVAISNYLWINTVWTIIVTFVCAWCLSRLQQYIERKLRFRS